MTCEYCGTEHPPQQIANPHYCIEMLLWELDIAQERIKELEETIYNIRYPHTTNPDEYVGDEIGGE